MAMSKKKKKKPTRVRRKKRPRPRHVAQYHLLTDTHSKSQKRLGQQGEFGGYEKGDPRRIHAVFLGQGEEGDQRASLVLAKIGFDWP